MIYDMNLEAINNMELYIFGKKQSTRESLIKAGISYTKRKKWNIIYNEKELWEYFNRDPQHQNILRNMKINSLDEMAYISFDRKLDESILRRAENENVI